MQTQNIEPGSQDMKPLPPQTRPSGQVPTESSAVRSQRIGA